MIGIPIFRRSDVTADCEACGRRFHAPSGGICERCRRILCARHLHGSWTRRLLVDIGARSLCIDCRAGREPGAT